MTLSANDPIERFAQRMERRAKVLLAKVDRLTVESFHAIADQIYIYSPVWSSQSVVNWTASIGRSPKRRLVNVDRSNASFSGGKSRGHSEGNRGNITPHDKGRDSIAEMARFAASAAAKSVANGYPKTTLSNTRRPPPIWLSNVISYTPKLWTGRHTGPAGLQSVSLADTIEAGVMVVKRSNVWRF